MTLTDDQILALWDKAGLTEVSKGRVILFAHYVEDEAQREQREANRCELDVVYPPARRHPNG